MEDATCTDDTLELFRTIRNERSNISVALQTYMRRTGDDLESLLPLKPSIRFCKGIYVESEAIAFQRDREITENFIGLVERLFDGGGYPRIATHDDVILDQTGANIRARGANPDQYEYQMLLGVRPQLW